MPENETLSPSSKPLAWFLFLLGALGGTFLDLISKAIVFNKLKVFEQGSYELIKGILRFKVTSNTGIIWGLFQGNNFMFLIISVLAVPLIIIIWFQIREPHWLISLGLGLVMAGTLGNFYDRLVYKGVRDFIDFYLIKWPIFNLADAWITIGVILIIIKMLFSKPRTVSHAETC